MKSLERIVLWVQEMTSETMSQEVTVHVYDNWFQQGKLILPFA
jgi:hypothetical protein